MLGLMLNHVGKSGPRKTTNLVTSLPLGVVAPNHAWASMGKVLTFFRVFRAPLP